MKLKEYVPVYAAKLSCFTCQYMHDYIKFVVLYREYNSLENYILWSLHRYLNRCDNFVVLDEIYAKYPDVKDAHFLTMMKAAFKERFGADVETFYSSAL